MKSSEDLHQRRSNKASAVAASRERRAKRAVGRGNGHTTLSRNSRGKDKDGLSFCVRVSLLIGGAAVIFLFLAWGGALYHVSTTDEATDGQHATNNEGSLKHEPKVILGDVREKLFKPLRNKMSKIKKVAGVSGGGKVASPSRELYTSEAMRSNPWLGWQPPVTPVPAGASWRKCFKAPPTSDGSDQPLECRESPSELGEAPSAPDNWIPDVTMVRKMLLHGMDAAGNAFPPPLDDELCEAIGVSGGKTDQNKDAVTQTMIKGQSLSKTTVGGGTTGRPERPAPRLMCSVYTMADAHANRIRGMRDTWAGGCDGFLAFSTESDPRLPAISIEHDGAEEYDNMWQKIRSIWKFVGTHYLEQFDYFFIGGDDLFVMPQNLKEYLGSLDGDPAETDRFLGRRFNAGGHDYFNSGGAGYTLSQATLRKLMDNIDDAQHCFAKSHTSTEDVMIARCLRHLGINIEDTRDDKGRERFHPFAPGTHLYWKPPGKGQSPDWYEQYNKEWGLLLGKDCCAPDSVSFHYMKKASMVRHVQKLLYSCNS